jgi:hypothetical protein
VRDTPADGADASGERPIIATGSRGHSWTRTGGSGSVYGGGGGVAYHASHEQRFEARSSIRFGIL